MNKKLLHEFFGIFLTCFIAVLSIWFSLWFISNIIKVLPFSRKQCQIEYSSFENKYGFYEGCQVKIDGKWIDADRYRSE